MKHNTYYKVEYRLVSGGGINRGETGGYVCAKDFGPNEMDEMMFFLNKYGSFRCCNPYSTNNSLVDLFDVDDKQYYHIITPKIWKLTKRHDKSFDDRIKRQKGRYAKWEEWTDVECHDYVIECEYFDTKERRMIYTSGNYATLKDAFRARPRRDYKNQLLCDWNIYERELYSPTKSQSQ